MTQNNRHFSLIQTGKFTSTPSANPFRIKNFFLNVEFNYMGSNAFLVTALRLAAARIMHNKHRYAIQHTGIYVNDTDELLLYCDVENAITITNMIKEYIAKPYDLVGQSSPGLTTDLFWWCIDKSPMFGDWFAFTSNNINLFKESFDAADGIWMMMPNYEREIAYRKAVL